MVQTWGKSKVTVNNQRESHHAQCSKLLILIAQAAMQIPPINLLLQVNQLAEMSSVLLPPVLVLIVAL